MLTPSTTQPLATWWSDVTQVQLGRSMYYYYFSFSWNPLPMLHGG